jgi:hypothetical protein
MRQQLTGLVQPNIAAAVSRRLCELCHDHQFGERRRGADLPALATVPDRLDQFGLKKE